MSKKKQTPILSDKIAELIAPRRLLDPEIDSEDETTARAIDYGIDEDFDENEPVVSQLSDIRRKNVKLLHDVDAKYQGKVSSRKELDMDTSENEENSDFVDDDTASSDQNEVASTEKSLGEFSMLLTPRQKIKLAQNDDESNEENSIESDEVSDEENDIKSFAMKLNQSKQTTEATSDSDDGESHVHDGKNSDKWDDDYEGEEEQSESDNNDGEEEEEEEYGSDEEELSDFDGGDMMMPQTSTDTKEKQDLSQILPKQRVDDQINKGFCVQNQLQIWEKLLEVRIHSQKMLIKANTLPQPNKFQCLTQQSAEFSELANNTFDKVATLVTQMRDLQSQLLNQYAETKEIAKKRKRINVADATDSETKRNRLNDQLANDFTNFKEYQYSVISKWHDRTKVLTPGSIKTQKQQGNIDVLRKIDAVLANREDLIKKSQLLKGGYELFDKTTGIVEPKPQRSTDENGGNGENGSTENHTDESIYSSEVYDDTDFYHTQLRELIEYKTSSSNNVNEVAKQFVELQKLRKKMKKAFDTRASKGRKIRYVVHNKLVSFMAPNDPVDWTDEQKDELFKSLFGAQS